MFIGTELEASLEDAGIGPYFFSEPRGGRIPGCYLKGEVCVEFTFIMFWKMDECVVFCFVFFPS